VSWPPSHLAKAIIHNDGNIQIKVKYLPPTNITNANEPLETIEEALDSSFWPAANQPIRIAEANEERLF